MPIKISCGLEVGTIDSKWWIGHEHVLGGFSNALRTRKEVVIAVAEKY